MATTITDRLGASPSSPAYGNDLSALEALNGTGLAARIGSDQWALRTLTSGNAGIIVTYGDGASDNPTVTLSTVLSGIVALTPSDDDFLQRKAGAWTNRTPAQATADLSAFGGDAGSGGTKGLVPPPSAGDAGANKFLKATGGWAAVVVGQPFSCRLTLVSTNVQLGRCSGNYLFINGNNETIPSSGVTLSASGLTPSTLYYIYAYMNSGTMTLEASTTAWAVDSTYGHPIKTGDGTRTLVGMARPVTGPAWVDTAAQRFVVSYHNRRDIGGANNFTANRATSSTSYVELNTEIRCEFLSWADEAVSFGLNGGVQQSTGGQGTFSAIGVDGTTAKDIGSAAYDDGTFTGVPLPMVGYGLATVTEGYHYATLLGKVSANTGTWLGSATVGPNRCAVQVGIRG